MVPTVVQHRACPWDHTLALVPEDFCLVVLWGQALPLTLSLSRISMEESRQILQQRALAPYQMTDWYVM